MYTSCHNCGSDKIIPDLSLHDDNTGWGYSAKDHFVSVARKPAALIFQDKLSAPLRAFICGECGYTALFAEGAAQLYAAYQQSLSRASGDDRDL